MLSHQLVLIVVVFLSKKTIMRNRYSHACVRLLSVLSVERSTTLTFSRCGVSGHSQFRALGRKSARESPLSQHSGAPEPRSTLTEASANELTSSTLASAVSPDSPLAYKNRLSAGRFSSIFELLAAPYAPHRLQVLKDVISATGTAQQHAAGFVTALHVAAIYDRVQKGVKKAVAAHELIGDRQSASDFRIEVEEVTAFQSWLEDSDTGLLSRVDNNQISGGVGFEILRCQLKATAALGLSESSVYCLQMMRQLASAGYHNMAMHDATSGDNISAHQDVTDVVLHELSSAEQPQQFVVSGDDHACALQSCERARRFGVALSLFRQLLSDAESKFCGLSVDQDALTMALVSLAKSVKSTEDFLELRKTVVSSDISAIPVSLPLYNSLIVASSRATGFEERMTFAVSLYRRLRDVQLLPNADTYASLIAVCASCGEPTHAFAFYREALTVCDGGAQSFPPEMYENFVKSYSLAGYHHDARQNLEVLLEAGAPLTRKAYHAALLSAPTSRDASEILSLMAKHDIVPTPTTFALTLNAELKKTRGLQTLLHAYDIHTKCLECVSVLANGSSADCQSYLIDKSPEYCEAVENICLSLGVTNGQRTERYINTLTNLVQADTNKFLGFSPQQPTRLPPASYVAVLAPDVLSQLNEFVVPSLQYFSAIVIPHSSVALLRRGTSRGDKGELVKQGSDEFSRMLEQRQHRLRAFLQRYGTVVHLMSVAEEVSLCKDLSRYGIGVPQLAARPAGVAISLARGVSSTPVYRDHACHIVLATTKFHSCGKFLVKNRLRRDLSEIAGRIHLWNPDSQPGWSPQDAIAADNLASVSTEAHASFEQEEAQEVSVSSADELMTLLSQQ